MTNLKINEKSDALKIEGHRGNWCVIDTSYYKGRKVFLLEHETYGDEAASIIVGVNGDIIQEEVYNGFSDLES